MKNLTVYVGALKICLDIEKYQKDGESTFIADSRLCTQTTSIEFGFDVPNVETIDNQAILIKNKYGNFYEFNLNNSFIDNLKINFNLGDCLSNIPTYNGDIFYEKESLVPYYDEQPKKLSFRKLKKDLLCDPRMRMER